MARILKIVKEMLSEPSTMQHNKIVKVLKYFDMKPRKMKRKRKKGTSHVVYTGGGRKPITVPITREVKQCYIKDINELLELEEWYEKRKK